MDKLIFFFLFLFFLLFAVIGMQCSQLQAIAMHNLKIFFFPPKSKIVINCDDVLSNFFSLISPKTPVTFFTSVCDSAIHLRCEMTLFLLFHVSALG